MTVMRARDKEFYLRLGKKLKELRTNAEIEQIDLALAVNIAKQNLSGHESGRRALSAATLFDLLYELDAPESEVLEIFRIFADIKYGD